MYAFLGVAKRLHSKTGTRKRACNCEMAAGDTTVGPTPIREKPVPRENSFDVSCAVRPRTKFLYDPGSKTRRGVRQSKGERLGPSTLNPAITGFLLQPGPELLKVA